SATNLIVFAITNLTGSGIQTISPASALPSIFAPVVIDGYTQTNSSPNPPARAHPNTLANADDAVLLIELNGSSAGSVSGITLGNSAASRSTVRGLVINRFLGRGIDLAQVTNCVIEGNFIGT